MREIADQRMQYATGELPAVRFAAERASLQPPNDNPPFEQTWNSAVASSAMPPLRSPQTSTACPAV
jgi:hypothetical protein|tara:strand:+ start:5372 stop:5569 length:198 start_codon:yes stop_codon:yes gene_type:complete